jgi:hypothetical protein
MAVVATILIFFQLRFRRFIQRKLRKKYLRSKGISDVAVLGLVSGKVPPEVLSKFSKEFVGTKPNKIPPKVLPKYIREDTKK